MTVTQKSLYHVAMEGVSGMFLGRELAGMGHARAPAASAKIMLISELAVALLVVVLLLPPTGSAAPGAAAAGHLGTTARLHELHQCVYVMAAMPNAAFASLAKQLQHALYAVSDRLEEG